MGLLMAALGGAADQGIDSINKQQAIDAQSALVQQSSDLTLQREKAIEDYKVQNANAARQTKVGLINTQLATNADNSVAGKFDTTALPDTEVNSDGTPGSTPMPDEAKQNYADAQATLASAKDASISAYMGNDANKLRAAVDAGYDDQSKLVAIMTDDRRTKAQEAANIIAQQRVNAKDDANVVAAHKIDLAIANLGAKNNGNSDEAKQRTALLTAERGNQIAIHGQVSDLTKSMEGIVRTTPEYADALAAKTELNKQLTKSVTLTSALSKKLASDLGLPTSVFDDVAPPAPTAGGLPVKTTATQNTKQKNYSNLWGG
jgi:hypothetical protein